jgi:hypothetical protein
VRSIILLTTGGLVKLRIKGNSIRLRVLRAKIQELLRGGRVQEAVHFTADGQSKLIYAAECSAGADAVSVRFNQPEIVVTLPMSEVRKWGESDQVGIYSCIALGQNRSLEIVIEKDFACLDRSDTGNLDTFPNPRSGAVC